MTIKTAPITPQTHSISNRDLLCMWIINPTRNN